MPRMRHRRVVAFVVLACLGLAAPATATLPGGGRMMGPRDFQGRAYGRNFAGCLPESTSFPGQVITASAPPKWTCGRLRRLWHHADTTDGAFFTFRLFGHRWQCPVITRPDHGPHTTLGCFHVHSKFDLEGRRPPGKPVVHFFLPFGAG